MRQRMRWVVVAGVLAVGWLVSPSAVPLYDGVGFPDEPYRQVPATRTDLPAATAAELRLRLVGGVNPGGLLANSAEQGPQVTFFAPPQAFGVAGAAAGEVLLRVAPVPLTAPAPPGRVASNVYALTLTSAAGPVTVRPQAQSPAITLRALNEAQPMPVMHYRASPAAPWRPLATQQVGRDILNAAAPGAGEYVLARPANAAGAASTSSRGPLLLVGLGIAVLLLVVLGIRLLARKEE